MTLVPFQGSLLAQTREWTNLHDDELRRRAVKAAGEKDVAALVSLTTAYLAHQGGSGVLTSPRTTEAYALGVRQFLEYATEQAVNLLRPGRHDAQSYINHMLAAGRKPAGVQLKVAAASCLYRALRWAGATDADPFRDARVPKDRTPGIVKRPPYSEDELADVLDHADVHVKFLLFVTAHAGLRISEALALQWDDVDEAGRRLHVRSGKGRKARLVAMSTSLARAARHYRGLYGPGGPDHQDGKRTTPREYVFRYGHMMTARYHVEKAFKAAGVPFRGFHPGRKYAGTRLLRQIKDFGRVAAHLGHESVDTTRKGYAQLAADDLKDDLAGW
ncbi:tyrosine-type recombinase/integrase [Deinococcus multiflagellatus]|uniref:Tyrosine-type recombinase/integrase n=1 Tax=Deinococcus multiflagellatus TaxID=1656887 RepID=A0ABW1ZPR3_9DEIO|nr:site-specific integrase [Deinococcus multiflagellatus]MBZ9714936.1 site-specific integrase [Deinococcus multiflagellatus]